jgi:hypothetical protein
MKMEKPTGKNGAKFRGDERGGMVTRNTLLDKNTVEIGIRWNTLNVIKP